jgi:predicted PurR-regulated permease PerM
MDATHRQVHTLLLMAVTVVGLYLCYRLAAPFVPAMAGALALAVLCAPLHRALERRLGGGSLAAGVCVLIVVLLVALPGVAVASRVLHELQRAAVAMQALFDSGGLRTLLDRHAFLAPVGQWLGLHVDLGGAVAPAASWLADAGASFLQGSVLQVIGVVLVFYTLFYMLRDRTAVLRSLRALSPLSDADMTRLYSDVADTVHATVNSTLIVAAVQGTLGGLMFWWLVLPEPLLWGVVMGALAVVPVLGAFVVWVPVAIYLALAGEIGRALVLAAWGALVVGGIDNLLYPILLGHRLREHTLVAFVSIVGGLVVFGPAGFILGPVIVTVTRLLLEIWRRPTQPDLAPAGA